MSIDGFNMACKSIDASFLKVGDESMSAICFRAKAKVNLLTCHIYPQDRATGYRVQDSCLICYRVLTIN